MNLLINSRVTLFVFIMVYALSVHFAHTGYLAEQHYLPGFFDYGFFELFDYVFLVVLVIVSAMVLPVKINNVSSIFVIVLYFFLYLPVFIISLGHDRLPVDERALMLLSVAVSFFSVCLSSKFFINNSGAPAKRFNRMPGIFLLLWIVALILFISKFKDVMYFRGLDEVYVQRELGKASTSFEGYLQIYFGYFLSLVVFSFGLYLRRYSYLVCGLLGCFLLYLVTAERTIFVLPLFVFMVFLAVRSEKAFVMWLSIFLGVSAILFVCVGLFYNESSLLFDLGFYYLSRIVAIPGVFFEQYYKYFSEIGFTNYSHVSVLNFLVEPDISLLNDPLYPQIGKIVARDVHHINSNSNASFLATDGAAAFGFFGVVIVSLALSLYLLLVDMLTRNWPLAFIVPAMSPLSIILTNGSFFTVLLSFGGLLWVAIFLISRFNFCLRAKVK
ncbi:hypothetical protein [Atopomonas sediminilitoris]|uniref:hypothetical protein n=1 Tax=Atopomonas sediminilitoris TaxID=2919919 RepID=UPI001F4ED8E6|nr:hypothetical protein [Atopomonas sediminilitoris]MCJ8168339.1 hypothetical protein [Atopomonas sediminilitoris]